MNGKKFVLTLLAILISGFAASSHAFFGGALSLYPKLSIKGSYADGSFEYFSRESPYKSATAMFEVPLVLHLADNLYADVNYFIRADGNKNYDEDTYYTYNFQKAALTYKNDFATFTIGRQGYQSHGKDFIIYYGQDDNVDNRLPTALDAASHTLNTKFISYSLIAGKESKSLSLHNDNSLVYGGSLMLTLGDILLLDAFYYARQTDNEQLGTYISNTIIKETDFAVYGAGAQVNLTKATGLSFYAAFNSGTQKETRGYQSSQKDLKGYAFNGQLFTASESDYTKTDYTINVFYSSPHKNSKDPFIAINQNLDAGFIFGGNNLYFTSLFSKGAGIEASSQEEKLIISLRVDIHFQNIKYLSFNAGIYNFSTSYDYLNSSELGSEIDLGFTYARGPLSISLMYGLFIAGEGFDQETGPHNPILDKNINKIGINMSWAFSI